MDGEDEEISDFSSYINGQLVRVNALLAASTIVIGVLVGIGAYGQRYRHHPLTGFLFLGATTLFLPILSYVVSTIGNQDAFAVLSQDEIVSGWCTTGVHVIFVFVWASLVQIAAINTTAIVAGDDKKGQNVAPPAPILLVHAIWISYLAVNFLGRGHRSERYLQNLGRSEGFPILHVDTITVLILTPLFALVVAKLLVKYYAWYGARGSLAFGRNPHLIVGYMEQIKAELASEEHALPPLIVTGEDITLVHKEPHGYSLNQADGTRRGNNGLVTIDKIWQSLEDDILPRFSTKQFTDLCFSFALFKLLRCRFARHTIAEFGFIKAHSLLPHVLLQDGDDERAFGLIAHELSFLHDYYYSSLPTTYSRSWLPILSIFISLLSMGWSFFYLQYIGRWIVDDPSLGELRSQLYCTIHYGTSSHHKKYGNVYLDAAPLLLLATLVVLAEVRDIASYICSNWTKVYLICRYVRHASSWQQSPWKKKLLGRLLRCQCRLLKHWEDKMNQCSVLALHPSTTPAALLRRLIPLLDRKKVPSATKTAVLKPLRSPSWSPSNGVASLCTRLHLQAGDNPLSASSGVKGVADTMLVVHIATSILETRRSEPPRQADSDHKVAATHLSCYCAYLVSYAPELLPDDDVWCKSLYKAVQKEARRALMASVGGAVWNPEALVRALSAGPELHDVLKNGAELGKKLVELAADEGEEAGWEALADFWSEMILYAAPSDNVDGHADAVARGGELITLLWALLTHLGVVSRPETAATPNAPGYV